jgi:WD40 repeat protein
MSEFWNAFISYGRADSKAFAAKLHQRLCATGLNIWFDQNDIPLGVDFQNQIDDGIDKSDNFLFIIAPHSINSPYCLKEIVLALKRQKRIIPLLHVEEISQETWQARNPNGTQEDWENYKAAGKHSSFPNMHPEIGKINWVYFREGIDDFETSFAGLVDLIDRHKDYVHEHTVLLERALHWDKNQRQSRYLLAGDDRSEAIAWLKTRFTGKEQAPCEPTFLQCDYICESIKNANNLLSDVFVCASTKNAEMADRLRSALMRDGITLWNPANARSGSDLSKAISQGIEQATNFVYLISPESVTSENCTQQLDYAIALNKRIIPIKVVPTPTADLPESLKTRQFIKLDACETQEEYDVAIGSVLKQIKENSAYFEQHKTLLVRALKWEAQNYNAGLLLRGYNLESAESWLQAGRDQHDSRPLPIHEKLIETSKNQPPNSSLDVFLSYARTDGDFARQLNDALQTQGKVTWFDQEAMSATGDAEAEMRAGIAQADNFIYVISPTSVTTDDCQDELEYAKSLTKRIIPVLLRDTNPGDIDADIRNLPTINFADDDDFFVDFNELVRTIDIDREHVQSHTKWLQRAIEWEDKQRPDDLLLRGSEFAIAQAWKDEAIEYSKNPPVTELQSAFIQASKDAIEAAERAERERQEKVLRLEQDKVKAAEELARKQKAFLAVVSGALVVSVGLGIAALVQRQIAVQKEQEALRSGINALGKSSRAVFALNQRLDALAVAIQAQRAIDGLAVPDAKLADSSEQVLRQAVYGVREQNRLEGHDTRVNDVSFSPDGQLLASASGDRTIKLWKPDGTEVGTLEGHTARVWNVTFSPDGKTLASASIDRTVRLWDVATMQEIRVLEGHKGRVWSLSFAPDGKTLASGSADQTIKLWNVDDGTTIGTLSGHTSEVEDLAFVDDKTLVSGGDDGTIRIWDIATTAETKQIQAYKDGVWGIHFNSEQGLIVSSSSKGEITTWNLDGEEQGRWQAHESGVTGLSFSPDGQTIASGSLDGIVKIWTLKGKLLDMWVGHEAEVTGISFQKNGGSLVASSSRDKTVRLWQRDTTLLKVLNEHDDRVRGVAYSPDGRLFASGSWDNTVRLWSPDGLLLKTLSGHTDAVYGVTFSPDSSKIASASADNSIRIWSAEGDELKVLKGHDDKVNSVAFSGDGKYLVSASDDETVGIWDVETGENIQFLQGHKDEIPAIAFDPNSDRFVSASDDTTAIVWNLKGEQLMTLSGHQAELLGIAFSPDGQSIATASADNTVKLWDQEGQEIATMQGHEGLVNAVAFSADGKRLASGSTDQKVNLWDLEGNLITTLSGHGDGVMAVAFNPDGSQVISGSNDSSVIITPVAEIMGASQLLYYGCTWAADYLRTNVNLSEIERTICDGVEKPSPEQAAEEAPQVNIPRDSRFALALSRRQR